MKVNPLKVFKISTACCIAILLADLLGLTSSTSAGIITLLSIQDTKKATFQIAVKRLLAFIPAIFFALLIFWTVGFHVFSFGIFLFVFILFCYFAKLHENFSFSIYYFPAQWRYSPRRPSISSLSVCLSLSLRAGRSGFSPRDLPVLRCGLSPPRQQNGIGSQYHPSCLRPHEQNQVDGR